VSVCDVRSPPRSGPSWEGSRKRGRDEGSDDGEGGNGNDEDDEEEEPEMMDETMEETEDEPSGGTGNGKRPAKRPALDPHPDPPTDFDEPPSIHHDEHPAPYEGGCKLRPMQPASFGWSNTPPRDIARPCDHDGGDGGAEPAGTGDTGADARADRGQ
jgi:hypothetical protein